MISKKIQAKIKKLGFDGWEKVEEDSFVITFSSKKGEKVVITPIEGLDSRVKENLAGKIIKRVVKIIQHFRKQVGGEWHNLQMELPDLPMFRRIVLIAMTKAIQDEKFQFDDWEKTEIGRIVYEGIYRDLHGNDDCFYDTNWSYCKEGCEELIKLNALLKKKFLPKIELPNASQINAATRAYNSKVESFVKSDMDMAMLPEQGHVDEHLDGSVL